MAVIMDGKALAAKVKQQQRKLAEELKAKGVNPCLAVVIVGENPASKVYVAGKIRDCDEVGIESREYALPETTTQEELLALVNELNNDSAFSGFIVQLPLPAHIDEKAVIRPISPEKDV